MTDAALLACAREEVPCAGRSQIQIDIICGKYANLTARNIKGRGQLKTFECSDVAPTIATNQALAVTVIVGSVLVILAVLAGCLSSARRSHSTFRSTLALWTLAFVPSTASLLSFLAGLVNGPEECWTNMIGVMPHVSELGRYFFWCGGNDPGPFNVSYLFCLLLLLPAACFVPLAQHLKVVHRRLNGGSRRWHMLGFVSALSAGVGLAGIAITTHPVLLDIEIAFQIHWCDRPCTCSGLVAACNPA